MTAQPPLPAVPSVPAPGAGLREALVRRGLSAAEADRLVAAWDHAIDETTSKASVVGRASARRFATTVVVLALGDRRGPGAAADDQEARS